MIKTNLKLLKNKFLKHNNTSKNISLESVHPINSSTAEVKFEDFMQYPKSSTKERIKKLDESKKRNIVYIYDQLDFSTFRYRALNLLEIYQKYFTNITPHVFFLNEISELYNYIRKIDLIILVRTSWTVDLESLIFEFKKLGKKIIYDIDDLIISEEHIRNIVKNDYQAKDNNHISILFAVVMRKI